MMTTTDRTTTDYVVPSVAERAAEMGRALQEAQHALAAARQRLTVHTAQRPATAADVTIWARRKAELTAEIEGFEGLVNDARVYAQQADAELKQQRVSELRVEGQRLRAAHEQTKAAIRAQMEELAVQMRTLAEEGAAEDQARQVLVARWSTVSALMEADRMNDMAAIRRLAPLMIPIVGIVTAVWPIVWPDVDPSTIPPGPRVGMFISYMAAAYEDAARRFIVVPSTAPPVA